MLLLFRTATSISRGRQLNTSLPRCTLRPIFLRQRTAAWRVKDLSSRPDGTPIREFLADAGSVELTKNPDAMISALRMIEGRGELPGATSAAMEMCVDSPRQGFGELFDTRVLKVGSPRWANMPAATILARLLCRAIFKRMTSKRTIYKPKMRTMIGL